MKCKSCQVQESSKWRSELCNSCYLKQWRENNSQSVAQYSKNIEVRFNHSKRIAKRRCLEWSLSLEEFAEFCNKPCHYCANKLGKVTTTCSGLDRLDNSTGYISGNIIPCCKDCNTIRSDILSVDETKQVINLIIKLRNL